MRFEFVPLPHPVITARKTTRGRELSFDTVLMKQLVPFKFGQVTEFVIATLSITVVVAVSFICVHCFDVTM